MFFYPIDKADIIGSRTRDLLQRTGDKVRRGLQHPPQLLESARDALGEAVDELERRRKAEEDFVKAKEAGYNIYVLNVVG